MSVRHRILGASIVITIVISVFVVLTHDEPTRAPEARGQLLVDAPSRHDAGLPLPVSLSGADPAVEIAQVIVTATAGSHSTTVSLDGGAGEIEIDGPLTRSAGVLEVWAIAGTDEAVAAVRIEPRQPVEPIVPFVGPKSIVADGDDHSMVVAIISDRFGNPVPNRGEALLRARQPGERETGGGVETTGLVTWRRVFSGTSAGRAAITVSLGGVMGPVADLDEVAGPPAAIHVATDHDERMPFRADGRRLHRVLTEPIVDRFANVVTDGTAVTFQVVAPAGRRLLTAATIGGRAEVWLEAPDLPGPVRIVAGSSGVESDALVLDYSAAVDEIPAQISRRGDGWEVEVGPVPMVDGGWIPDGTEVSLLVSGRPAVQMEAVDGRVLLVAGSRPPLDASVLVLGVERRIT